GRCARTPRRTGRPSRGSWPPPARCGRRRPRWRRIGISSERPHARRAAVAAHGADEDRGRDPTTSCAATRAAVAAYFIRNAGFAMLYFAMIFSMVPSFFMIAICSFMAFTSAGLSRRELKTVYALLTVSGMYSFAWMASYLRFHSGCWVASHALVGAPSKRACTRLAIRSWIAASIVL